MATPTLAALRLFQVSDSSFPVGGYAFSHGVEWLVHRRAMTCEADVAAVVEAYVAQTAARQAFPSALASLRALSIAAVLRADERLDVSMAAEAEREAGRAMGERLLAGATDALGGDRTAALLLAVRDGRSPGQFAVAFGAVAHDQGAGERAMLAALGFGMVNAVAQAAIRLGVIGQAAAARVVAASGPALDHAIEGVIARRDRLAPGTFTPGLDLAGLLHPTLPFRMFVS